MAPTFQIGNIGDIVKFYNIVPSSSFVAICLDIFQQTDISYKRIIFKKLIQGKDLRQRVSLLDWGVHAFIENLKIQKFAKCA